MDKYEYKVRSEEISNLIEKEKYTEAVKIADTIDWRRVKSVAMLLKIAALYRINRRNEDSREMLMLAYERYPTNRSVVYSLCELSIELDDVVAAIEYYKQFVKLAPKDNGVYTLRYRILEAQEASLEERIEILEELKKKDYQEEWAYELAYLYHRVGLSTKCVEECDDIMLWFGDGPYVMKAMELKAKHVPLTDTQQQHYDMMLGNAGQNYSSDNYDTGEYAEGYDGQNYEAEGYDGQNYETEGYDGQNYEAEGYDGQNYGTEGYDGQSYEAEGYDRQNYETEGYSEQNYEAEGYSEQNYETESYGEQNYEVEGYSEQNYDTQGYDVNVSNTPYESGYAQYADEDYREQNYSEDQYAQDNYPNETYADENYTQSNYVDDGYGNVSYVEEAYQDNGGYTGEFYVEQTYDENGNLIDPETYTDSGYTQGSYDYPQEEETEYQNKLHLVENTTAAPAANSGDMSQYNTINLQKVVAESMKELFPDDNDDVFAEDREKYNSSEEIGSVIGDTHVFAGIAKPSDAKKEQTNRIPIAQMVTGVLEKAPEPHTGAIKKVFVPGEDARSIKSEPDIEELRDTTEKSVDDEHNRMEYNDENVYHEKNLMNLNEAGEISQARETEPINLDEVLVKWERIKQDNAKKHQEEIKQRVLSQTGKIFVDFDNSIKSGILGELEREEEEAQRSSQTNRASRQKVGFLDADVTGDILQKPASEEDFDIEYAAEKKHKQSTQETDTEKNDVEKTTSEDTIDTSSQERRESDAYRQERHGETKPADHELNVHTQKITIEGIENIEDIEDVESIESVEDDEIEHVSNIGEAYTKEEIKDFDEIYVEGETRAFGEAYTEEETERPRKADTENEAGYSEETYVEDETGDFEETYVEEAEYPKETYTEEEAEYYEERYTKEETAYPEKTYEEDEEQYTKELFVKDTKIDPGVQEVYDDPKEARRESGNKRKRRKNYYQYHEKDLDPEDAESIAEMAKEDALKTQEIKMNTADLSSLSEKIVATTKKEARGAKREEIRDFTPEEQTLFENFAVTKKIKKQIIYALENMTLAAYTGNVIITGDAGLDTVRMAKNLVKEYQASDPGFSGKLAKITGEKINQRNIKDVFEKLQNGGIIIEKANGMSEEKLYELAMNLNQDTLGIVVIMEDTKKEITKLLEKQAMIVDYFNIRIDLMEMDNNALVAYAKNYALALEYSIDELGTLALYTRIANMQSGNHVVTKDEVRDIIDEAIWKSKKSKIKNFVDVLFARRYDNEDMIVLKERDFM